MLNIGNRPTVKDAGELRIEVHILNIEMNLYGKELKIEMLDWIRGEKRFENLDKLTEQLELDRKEVIRRIS
jgi:riboflavin kinase / FMN adenylyltransferase